MHTIDDVHLQFALLFDDERIRPFAYLLSKRLQEGHICIPIDEVLRPDAGHPFSINKLPDLIKMKGLVSSDRSEVAPFVKDSDRLYFHRYHRYEVGIVDRIKQLILRGSDQQDDRMRQIEKFRNIFTELQADYSKQGLEPQECIDWQLVAVVLALLNDFTIITGGPGTGKTTTLSKVLRLLYEMEPNARVALAAPTGKASMRMFESLQRSTEKFPDKIKEKVNALTPSTLHSLLGYKRNSIYFKHDQENPLPFDWVIVDEASMIDVPMFYKLLEALGPQARIILLGDKDQLASVEAGSLLGDLCLALPRLNELSVKKAAWVNDLIEDKEKHITPSFTNDAAHPFSSNIIELKLSHRFKARGGIGRISHAIIHDHQDQIKEMMDTTPDPKVEFDKLYTTDKLEAFADGYRSYINEPDIKTALKKLNDLRVLVTVREGERGLYALNKKIENILVRKKLIYKGTNEFYLHRPVMVTRNNYEIELFNGDVGIVRPDVKGELRVWFEDPDAPSGVRPVLPAYLDQCETVFAMTIHKSQGSEFNEVLVILPEGINNLLLTRELIYTGVTRAKEKVIIQGTQETLLFGAAASVKRYSGIKERINSPL